MPITLKATYAATTKGYFRYNVDAPGTGAVYVPKAEQPEGPVARITLVVEPVPGVPPKAAE